MDNNFTEAMASRTDSELLEIILLEKKNYQPEALDAAEKEYKKRNLSEYQIEIATNILKEKELINEAKANEPLMFWQKILFFVFAWGIIPCLFTGTFKTNGYDKKYIDSWKYIKYGLISFIIFIGLVLLLMFI